MIELTDAAIEALANALFGVVVVGAFSMLIVAILFLLLALRGIWRWLTRLTWRDVIISTERKALRSK